MLTAENQLSHWIVRISYYVLVLGITLAAAYTISVLIVPIVLGFLLSYMLQPIVNRLERMGISRHLGSMLVLGLLLGTIGLALRVSYPKLSRQFTDFKSHDHLYLTMLESKAQALASSLSDHLPKDLVEESYASAQNHLIQEVKRYKTLLPEMLSHFLSALIMMLFAPVVAFFFLAEGSQIKKFLVSLVPNRYFEMSLMILHRIDLQLGSYLRGQLLDCLAIGVLAAIGLSILNVKYALFIGAFAGLANVIPYVGPVAGAIPGMLVLMISPNATFPWWSVAVMFVIIKAIDDVFIYPSTVGKSLHLHPLLVILGILAGEHFGGVLGMLIVIPLMGIIKAVVEVLHNTLRSYRII